MIPWYKKATIIKRVFFYSSSCCAPEEYNLFTSRYDPKRLGFIKTENMNDSDLIIISGAINNKTEEIIRGSLGSSNSKKIIAIGGCSISSGPLNIYEHSLPVDIYIPGCPPRPESILYGMLKITGEVD